MSRSSDERGADLSVARQWITAFNAHDVATIVSFYAEDAELNDSGMKYPRQGKKAIAAWFTQRFQAMPTITYVPTKYVCASEEQAVVTWTTHGQTPIPGGRRWLRWLSQPFQVDGVSVFTLQAGLIVQQRGYYDHLAVVEKVLPPLRWLPARF